jgi:hypothetical protein
VAASRGGYGARLARSTVAAVVVIASVFAGGPVAAAPPANAAPSANAADLPGASLVARWNAMLLDSVRNSKLGPPMVARALAIAHTCMYDAWAAYDWMATGTRYGWALRRPLVERTEANKAEAVSYAAHMAAVDLFPGRQAQLDAFMSSLGYDPKQTTRNIMVPAGVGNVACAAELDARHKDGSNQMGNPGYSDTTHYRSMNQPMVARLPMDPATVQNPNHWQPLTYPDKTGKVGTPGYLGAQWGQVTPFAMESGSAHRPGPPPAVDTPEFKRQADQLIQMSAALTDREKMTAEYWADGPNSETPPGHWNLFAEFVSLRDHNTLDQDVKLFFAVANAVFDAGIAAWDAKRAYDYVRPITGIRYLYRGQPITAWGGPGAGTKVIDGGSWLPYQPGWFPTPPFPEYVSGHSAFSAAAAEALRIMTGSDKFGYSVTLKAGTSFVEPNTPKTDQSFTWSTFSDAANDAALSRRFGGIHFESGDLQARAMGRMVGQDVAKRVMACLAGRCQG